MVEEVMPPSMRDRTTFLLWRAGELSRRLANEMLAPIDLEAREVGILTLVIERAPMTQKVLGDLLSVDRSTMVALIDDLEIKGYVERRRHPGDRRAFLIHPTEAGKTAKLDAVRILDEQKRRFLSPLTSAEQRQLLRLLKRLQASET
jgi:DNA-binding MarR family transcriptional regulator